MPEGLYHYLCLKVSVTAAWGNLQSADLSLTGTAHLRSSDTYRELFSNALHKGL